MDCVDHPSENRDCDITGETHGNSKFADCPLIVNDKRQQSSGQSNQHNRITFLIKKNTQIAEFSEVAPEQSKFIKPMDLAILTMTPKGDPNLTTYLNELLRMNNME